MSTPVSIGGFMGLRLEEITPSLVEDALALYLRIGMKDALTQAVAETVNKAPHKAIGTGFLMSVGATCMGSIARRCAI
ncbi:MULTISPECIES: hypothetical protein [unclassified Pseudomonas]|uniref:hypothetical protein n=1 Tax=unclassified Pseudomonas TaxID=196821 RepID=UPI002113AE4A|nr:MULTISPECIES: hypothetical protein [unclassified Pseudomonas]